jgi:predicted HTH domain antitoxin
MAANVGAQATAELLDVGAEQFGIRAAANIVFAEDGRLEHPLVPGDRRLGIRDWRGNMRVAFRMASIHLEIGEELSGLLENLGQPIEKTAREMIVFELYRRNLISSGKAAELLEVGKLDFIRRASDLGIPFFDLSDDEWRAEVAESKRIE